MRVLVVLAAAGAFHPFHGVAAAPLPQSDSKRGPIGATSQQPQLGASQLLRMQRQSHTA